MKTLTKIFTLLILFSCKTTVKLTLKNVEPFDQQPTVVIKNQDGIKLKEIEFGIVSAQKTDTLFFKVKKNYLFEVLSSYPGSSIIFKSGNISVDGRKNPYLKTLELKNRGNYVDESISMNTLSTSFKKIGVDIGADPLDVNIAINSVIGSLIVVEMQDDTLSKIVKMVSPNILGVKITKLEDIHYPSTNEAENVKISGSNLLKISAKLPMVSEFGWSFVKDDFYEMKWVIRGFGHAIKSEDSAKNPSKLISSLNASDKNQIFNLLKTKKNCKVFYVNRYYVIERAESYVKRASKVNTTTDLSASNFVTANGVFSFDQSQEQNKGYGPVVLNYWGDEVYIPVNRTNLDENNDRQKRSNFNNVNIKSKLITDFLKK